MGNILTPFKKFLGNKNTVTILGVLLGIVVLYIGYDMRVKKATTPVDVPFAKTEIVSRSLIEENMISYTSVPKSLVKSSPNMVTNPADIIGKYVSYATTIPKNSFFYAEVLMTKAEMPDSSFADIPDGYTIFSLAVDNHSTYGNSIFPDNTIDLYVKATDNVSKQLIFGKLIESIKVLDVKDDTGNHVFETTEAGKPAELLFAVPEDLFLLLKKATYLNGIEIEPVPRNASYSANPGETEVASQYLQSFILNQTVIFSEQQ